MAFSAYDGGLLVPEGANVNSGNADFFAPSVGQNSDFYTGGFND